MTAPPPIVLRPMLEMDRPAVLQLEVADSQRSFVDPIGKALCANADRWDNHVVVLDGAIIGFFQIDAQSEGPRVPGQIELHEVRIDRRAQGNGYGKSFLKALGPYLVATYGNARDVCLTVNVRNPVAYSVYEAGGFVDTGAIYPHGGAGPQHIMTMPLGTVPETPQEP